MKLEIKKSDCCDGHHIRINGEHLGLTQNSRHTKMIVKALTRICMDLNDTPISLNYE